MKDTSKTEIQNVRTGKCKEEKRYVQQELNKRKLYKQQKHYKF